MSSRCVGLVVAITGGGRGIGAATALELARRGAHVAVGDLDPEAAESAAAALGEPAIGLPVDVSDPRSFAAFVDAVEARLGPLDVLVNNAGIMPVGPFLEQDRATVRRLVDVNVNGVLEGSRLALARMVPRGSGHLVNVSSQAGRIGAAGAVAYSGSKAAVICLTEALRDEFGDSGVAISCVMPGIVQTELASGLARSSGFLKAIEPGEVAAAIADCVERPRAEVHVPRVAAVGVSLLRVLPGRLRRVVERASGTDRLALRASGLAARTAYEARVSGARPVANGTGSTSHVPALTKDKKC